MTMTLDHPQRLQALRELTILDTPPEECFDRLTRLASRILGVPVALVSLVDDRRQFFKSQQGLPEPWASSRETPLSHSFCQHVVTRCDVLNVEDAREHPMLKDNLAIPELGVIAYLGIPLTDGQGMPLGSFCAIDTVPRRWTRENEELMRDLAQATLSELELRRLGKELLDLNQQKNQLLSMAAHDLRTPLGAIAGYTSLLLGSDRFGVLSEPQRKLLDKSHRAAQYMVGLIDHLLDVSKIESGALTLDLQPHNVEEVLRQVLDIVSVLAENKGQTLQVTSQPVMLRLDSEKIQQVLLNLLSNAVKFSSAGSQIWVQLSAGEGQVRLAVRDQGPGISASDQERLFRPFCRTANRPTGGESSTGLGLTIAQSIAQGHGGRIEVESAPGQGSTFTLVLPAS